MRTGIDCFAGIGGFSLAMQRCGVEPRLQIEIDEFCQRVLKKNFPKVTKRGDICSVPDAYFRRLKPWIVCGGFPCQDVSSAGKAKGANEGERSGLWRELWRVIRITRPDWVLIENVPALRTRGADSVLSALEALGYSAWALVVGAIHVGAPHQRQRVWIVGYATSKQCKSWWSQPARQQRETSATSSSNVGDPDSKRRKRGSVPAVRREDVSQSDGASSAITDSETRDGLSGVGLVDSRSKRYERRSGEYFAESTFRFPAYPGECQYGWEQPRAIPIKSGLGRTIDGLPGRLDNHRIKALGNAIVPQVAEAIIRSIIAVEAQFS